uniref:Uncharacterized protein n=1 Tax=Latimeria chalumnae TaxID=7897 RepID=M3XLD7_LATCH
MSDSIHSADSTGTLASSVIEVETAAETGDLCAIEEPLATTFSITEEILELLNQSGQKREKEEGPELEREEELNTVVELESHFETLYQDAFKAQSAVGNAVPLQDKAKENQSAPQNSFEESDVEVSSISTVKNSNLPTLQQNLRSTSDSSEEEYQSQENGPSPLHVLEELAQEEDGVLANQSDSSPLKEVDHDIPYASQGSASKDSEPEDHVPHSSCSNASKEILPCNRELDNPANQELLSANSPSQKVPSEPRIASGLSVDKPEKGPDGKRDSSLTKNDRLLIEKIKNYYETAEIDDDFCLQRRESISFIPRGVVKESIFRFNYILQQDSIKEEQRSRSQSSISEACTSVAASAPPLNPNSGQVNGLPCVEEDSEGKDYIENNDKSHLSESKEEEENEFKSCAEIRKAWKEKEMSSICMNSCNSLRRGAKYKKNSSCPQQTQFNEPLLILEESDFASSVDSVKDRPNLNSQKGVKTEDCVGEMHCPSSTQDLAKGSQKEPPQDSLSNGPCCTTSQIPEISLYEGDCCLIENSEKIINKVQMLARLYSEKVSRMKTQRRGWESRSQMKKKEFVQELPSVQEEKHHHSRTPGGSRSSVEPQVYGHIIIRESFPQNFIQENTFPISATKENSLECSKKALTCSPSEPKDEAKIILGVNIGAPTQEGEGLGSPGLTFNYIAQAELSPGTRTESLSLLNCATSDRISTDSNYEKKEPSIMKTNLEIMSPQSSKPISTVQLPASECASLPLTTPESPDEGPVTLCCSSNPTKLSPPLSCPGSSQVASTSTEADFRNQTNALSRTNLFASLNSSTEQPQEKKALAEESKEDSASLDNGSKPRKKCQSEETEKFQNTAPVVLVSLTEPVTSDLCQYITVESPSVSHSQGIACANSTISDFLSSCANPKIKATSLGPAGKAGNQANSSDVRMPSQLLLTELPISSTSISQLQSSPQNSLPSSSSSEKSYIEQRKTSSVFELRKGLQSPPPQVDGTHLSICNTKECSMIPVTSSPKLNMRLRSPSPFRKTVRAVSADLESPKVQRELPTFGSLQLPLSSDTKTCKISIQHTRARAQSLDRNERERPTSPSCSTPERVVSPVPQEGLDVQNHLAAYRDSRPNFQLPSPAQQNSITSLSNPQEHLPLNTNLGLRSLSPIRTSPSLSP